MVLRLYIYIYTYDNIYYLIYIYTCFIYIYTHTCGYHFWDRYFHDRGNHLSTCTIKCKENIFINLILFFIFIVSIDIQIIQFTSLPFFYPLRSFVLGLPSCDLSFGKIQINGVSRDFMGFHGGSMWISPTDVGIQWDVIGIFWEQITNDMISPNTWRNHRTYDISIL